MANLKTILYVEDDADIRTVAELALSDVGGFDVKVCSSGKEAIAAAQEMTPDLLLLDVMMPDMDGLETLAALREIPHLKETTAFFMTAKVQDHEIQSFQDAGVKEVIVKPFDPMTLSEKLVQAWQKTQNT